MSPRERTAWIRLASLLVVAVPYSAYVIGLFEGGAPVGQAICVAFVVATVAYGVLSVASQTIARMVFGADRVDERDAAIDARSLQVSYFALIHLMLLALCAIAFIGAVSRPSASGTILLPGFALTSQYVLWCLVVAEAARHATQLFCYRREAWS